MRAILISKQKRLERSKARGSVLVEAALVIPLIFVPLALSVMVVGLNLIRATSTNQLNRDAGHIFARGVDLSGSSNGLVNRGVLFHMAPALQTTSASGTAVLVLSHIIYIAPTTCTTCPYTCSNCSNLSHAVFDKQITLGNAALRASSFGTVPGGSKDATSGIVSDPYGDSAVRADGVTTYLTLGVADGAPKDVYVSETYFSSADLFIAGIPGPPGVYARSFF